MRDLVLLHEGQAALGVEVLHDHDRAAHALGRHGPDERGGVIERRRTEIHVPRAEAHDPAEHAGQDDIGTEGLPGERPADPLGVPGGARGVQHGGALDLFGQRLPRRGGYELVVGRVVFGGGGPNHEPEVHIRGAGDQLGGQGCQRSRRDERAGAAVDHDVGRLVDGQVRVDHRVVETRTLERERHLVGPVVVGQEHGHVIPRPQTVGEQGLGQAAGTLFELGERDDLAGAGDDGWPLSVAGGVGGGAEMGGAGVVGAHRPLLAHGTAAAPTRGWRLWTAPSRGRTLLRFAVVPRCRRAGRRAATEARFSLAWATSSSDATRRWHPRRPKWP